ACRTIALISQKGGSGKTTVTMQLAAGLARTGRAVAIADLDPQQSASRWSESAPASAPFPATVVRADGADPTRAMRQAARGADVLILDCPASLDHPHTGIALDSADLAIIPAVPGPIDMWSARATERLILDHPRRKLSGALLPNRVMRTALAEDVIEVMRDFELPLLDAALTQRSAYALSAVRGGSVFTFGRIAAVAQQEVERLVSAVLAHLEE